MQILPQTRRARIGAVALVLLVVIAVIAVVNRRTVEDVYTYFFPGERIDDAEQRTSAAAPTTDGLPTPAPSEGAPATTAASPTDAPTSTASSVGTSPVGTVRFERILEEVQPLALADRPGHAHTFVAAKDGRILSVPLRDDPAANPVPAYLAIDLRGDVLDQGEQGLLGLALDPGGERLYANYTSGDGDTRIRSWSISDLPTTGDGSAATVDDSVLHLEIGQPFRNHNGGHLVFGPDGALWIGTGDGGSANDPADRAQDVDSILGKMLRVIPNPDGGVFAPASNPDWGGRPEIWAIGLRNPWRYSFDRLTGALWIADVGQNEIEEVSTVDPAEQFVDFGWDTMEGSEPFEGQPSDAFTDPVIEYTHAEGCSIAGGYVYRGSAVPTLAGWYLFADFCSGWIRAVPADDPGQRPVDLDADIGQILSFGELRDGEVVVFTTDGIYAIVAV